MVHGLEPWTPRVGDWVRADQCASGVVARLWDENGRAWSQLDIDGAQSYWHVTNLEPCAPPEANPSVHTVKRVRASAEASVAAVGGEEWRAEPCAPPADRVVVGTALHASKPDGTVTIAFNGSGPIVGQRVDYLIIDDPHKSAPPRDHNATCARCGGRAYQGIGAVRCVEPVCDDPRERMPDSVKLVAHVRMREDANSDRCEWVSEDVYEATGRGVIERHPTKEGAILAWREAVNRV